MKGKFTPNYSPVPRAKVALNIFDFARRLGPKKIAGAMIRGASVLAVIFALLLIVVGPAQAQN